ncbi:MAG: alanine racemase [Planctomycetes bacterium]|nr:alanine racemase [Planctomycetota bacterium]
MAERIVDPHRDPAVAAALGRLGTDGATLTIDGLPVTELAERFGTPAYLFSARVLQQRVLMARSTLGDRVRLLWSIKANPSLALTRILAMAGTGAEIASLGELQIALAAGHPAAALRFAGPGKTDHELANALAAGLGGFHVESLDELEALAALAAARGTVAPIALRVNLPQAAAGSRLRMSGRAARFGIDADDVPMVLARVRARESLRLVGLHTYGGTQSFAAEAFVAQAQRLAEAAAAWERAADIRLTEIDVGGGFGVPTYCGDPEFDVTVAGQGLRRVLEAHDRHDRTWFVELGRWLVAPAGVYLTRVVRCRQSGGQQFVVLDGGLHHCAAAAGVGTVLRRPPLLVHATALQTDAREVVAIGGPLCTPADQFAEAVAMPPLRTGDLVAVLNAGAYGLTFSPTGFLSHPTPPEVLVEYGKARVIRDRGTAADALLRQQP